MIGKASGVANILYFGRQCLIDRDNLTWIDSRKLVLSREYINSIKDWEHIVSSLSYFATLFTNKHRKSQSSSKYWWSFLLHNFSVIVHVLLFYFCLSSYTAFLFVRFYLLPSFCLHLSLFFIFSHLRVNCI